MSDEESEKSGADLARSLLAAARKNAKSEPAKRSKKARPTRGSRDPAVFADAISGLVNERAWSAEVSVGALFGTWAEVVGQELASHVTPVSCQKGELVLRADSTAWATQVRLLAGDLKDRISAQLGSGIVETITVNGPSAPSWKKGPRSVRGGRGPRDTYG
ncbi:MAG TPA: DciA family protein [Candidatus Nanopelagicaceae bacterium]|nr:DciA family protein [Candidatus Nanopelagicaceae bacterium]